MDFILKTSIPEFPFRLSHADKCFMTGSCFTEHIGLMMEHRGFDIHLNPWGILFNPISIADIMEFVTGMKEHISIQPVKRDHIFVSLFQHSRLYGRTEEELSEKIQLASVEAKNFCKEANTFIITFGSANVFIEQGNKKVVANCHKQPSTMFDRKMLAADEIAAIWNNIISANPDKRFIFTVSPVRHSRDGLITNNLSKATLLLSAHQLCAKFPAQCFYFPSYEIVMDELRDYRFFKEDLVHPNETAVKYVWEKWEKAIYSEEIIKASNEYLKLVMEALHKSIFEQNDKSGERAERLIHEAEVLMNSNKNLNFNYLYTILEHA